LFLYNFFVPTSRHEKQGPKCVSIDTTYPVGWIFQDLFGHLYPMNHGLIIDIRGRFLLGEDRTRANEKYGDTLDSKGRKIRNNLGKS
jgi:hypothetical protein